MPVPPVTAPVENPAIRLDIRFLGPLYGLSKINKEVVSKIKTPIIFFKVIGSAFTKKDNPTKIDIDPDIEIGATSFQSKHFNAFGKIVIAPKI